MAVICNEKLKNKRKINLIGNNEKPNEIKY